MPRISLALLILISLGAPAWADAETAHPLVDRSFPSLKGLTVRPPFAILLWRQADGRTMRRFGEAKLVELAGSNPKLEVHSIEVTSGRPLAEKPYGGGIVQLASLHPVEFEHLRTETPVILTIDLQGRIHRVSRTDHWPTLSVTDRRFGAMPPPPVKPWWDLRRWL